MPGTPKIPNRELSGFLFRARGVCPRVFFCGGFGADLRAPKNGADLDLKEAIVRTANFPNGEMAFCRIVESGLGKTKLDLEDARIFAISGRGRRD